MGPNITSEPTSAATVHLFGGPYISCGTLRLAVPQGSKRLLAFVALRRGLIERPFAAGALWPSGDDRRAAGNLRSSLWRLRQAGIDVVEADKWSLALADGVRVDLRDIADWAGRLIHRIPEPADLTATHLPTDVFQLLAGWSDEWAILERERIRQRVLHALEALSTELSRLGRHAEAVEVALRAVAEEPLRESGQRALVEAHLAQGNLCEAQLVLRSFSDLLQRELGVRPSRRLAALVHATFEAGLATGVATG